MVEVTVLLAVQSSDFLAVNRSTEETIHTSGDSGWSLSIFHCKINSYAKVCIFYAYTVHDTENLTFSADNREDNPHIAVRLSTYVHADNQRIPRGHLEDSAWTISGFCAEQLADSVQNSAKTKITQSIDIRMILATCFLILQPVVVHEVRLLVSAIFKPNPRERSAPARTENMCPPALNLHPPAWKFRSTRAENPHRSSQLSTGVCAEQP